MNENNKNYQDNLKAINNSLLNDDNTTIEKKKNKTIYIKYNNKIIYTISGDSRPVKYTYKYKLELLKKLVEYIETEDYPTVPDFCRKNKISKQRIYEFASDKSLNKDDLGKEPLGKYFSDAIQKMVNNQEAFIEDNAINNKIPLAFAIFKLKQLGWTDRQQVEHSATDDIIKMIEAKNKMIKEAIDNSDL